MIEVYKNFNGQIWSNSTQYFTSQH